MNLFDPKPPANSEKILQIRSWVKDRLDLDEETIVMVSELRCSEPGCPPLETLIAVLDGPGQRRQFKFHKAIADMTTNDIDVAIPGI
jgi:hypothetical protein